MSRINDAEAVMLVRLGVPRLAASALALSVSAVLSSPAFALPLHGPGGGRAGLPEPTLGCPAQQGAAAPTASPWAQQALDFSAVWQFTRGAGVTVAVIDSGVDANPQFGNRITLGPDLAGRESGVPAEGDCVGHGTSVAGIIAAAPMAGVSFTGVAPAARILSIKITNTVHIPPALTPEAIRDAVNLGASVINLSLAQADSAALQSAVDYALARNVVVVAAAGNDEKGSTGPFYPAAYPGVLSVGAVQPDGSVAGFSDTRTPVSVTAPGVDITSAYPGAFPDAYGPDLAGTSFATPFVSGVVALVRAYHPRLDAAQVVARIMATADGPTGPGTGNGMINPVQAVTAVLPGSVLASGSLAGAAVGVHAGPVPISRVTPSGRYPAFAAVSVTAGAFGLGVLVVAGAVIIPAGRRRRWKPGGPAAGAGQAEPVRAEPGASRRGKHGSDRRARPAPGWPRNRTRSGPDHAPAPAAGLIQPRRMRDGWHPGS
jgi:membrane-anchored mycosin MYCP